MDLRTNSLNEVYRPEELYSSRLSYPKFFINFPLEVLGFSAPFWMLSDMLNFNKYLDINDLKLFIAITLMYASIRWLLNAPCFEKNKSRDDRSTQSNSYNALCLSGVEGLNTFILQVLGAAGSIWGASDLLDLRNQSTSYPWKVTATIAGFLALPFWFQQAYCGDSSHKANTFSFATILTKVTRVLVELIQQVLGSGSAIWGISEAMSLRPSPISNEIFDYIAIGFMVAGLIIFAFKYHTNQNHPADPYAYMRPMAG